MFAFRSFYFSFNVVLRSFCICILLTINGCSFSLDRGVLCSYLFTSSYIPIDFDEKSAIGFYATNGYWQLNLMRQSSMDSVYKINLIDYYSQPYNFVLHSLRRCSEKTFYSGVTSSKGIWKGFRMVESKNSFTRRVNFSCRCITFDSEAALINFLLAPWHNSCVRKLVSPEGILVCIESLRDETMFDVTVEVIQLLVENKSPSVEVLTPYVNGIFRWHSVKDNVNTFFANVQSLED